MERPLTRYYLVRHGQTASNRDGVIMGSRDLPLSPEGEAQAARLRAAFAGKRLDRVFASPMVRARRTAEILLEGRDEPVTYLADLREQDYGEWEGLPYGTLERNDPSLAARYFADPSSVNIPGGEPFVDFERRVAGVLEREIRQQDLGRNVLVVAHGGSLRILIARLFGLPTAQVFFRLWLDNGSVTTLYEFIPGGCILRRLNWTPGE